MPLKAQQLHAEARQAGSSGDYDKALDLLGRAGELAPDWPYPVYDAAFTNLLKGDHKEALRLYERVVEMAPRGFFMALTAVDCLRRESRGELPRGSYERLLMLEHLEDRSLKQAALKSMLDESPEFPAAWKELAHVLEDDESRLSAIEKGLSHRPDPETAGYLLFNKALILNQQGLHNEARRILGELALDPRTPLDIQEMAKVTLANDFKFGQPDVSTLP